MDLRVDSDALKELVAKSLVDNLTPEIREKLIKDAIAETLKAGSGSYDKRSPLQKAFDAAIEQETRKHAGEVIATDPVFQAQIKSLFADVSEKLFAAETRESLVDSLAQTIVRALTKDRY